MKPEFRDVRASFYNFSWKSPANTFLSGEMAALRARAQAIDPTLKTQPNYTRFYWSEDKTAAGSGYIADATDKANKGTPELDHVTPLGTRWATGKPKAGNNSTHPERDTDFQTDLQVISKKLNLTKSGPSFVFTVGSGFRGPKDV